MKTGDLAKLFGVSNTAIQNWTSHYADILSDKRGKHRYYNEKDVLILATVAKLSADGFSHEKIREKIDAGELVESPTEANFGVDTRMIPAAAVEQIVDSTELKVELEQIKYERDRLLDTVQELKRGMSDKDDEIKALNAQIQELQHKLGLAEGELLYRRKLDDKE